jgi:hypothetical protein
MENTRIKISSIVESQLPLFVREDYPLVTELLTEYYRSLEFKGSSYDLLQNIDQYVKVNNLSNLVENTTLTSDIDLIDDVIYVDNTEGFPNTYGLIYIDSEIILYKSKTLTSFNECIRGFSGITEFSVGNTEDFSFNATERESHISETLVVNLSSLFLKEFFLKTKKQFLPGFDGRELYENLNENIFLKQSKDFYTSKGTDRSFEILFRVLYGKNVDVILPKDYLIKPSNAEYRVTRNIVVESIEGDVELLKNKTIFQDKYENIPKSFGTVVDIEKLIKNEKEYYILKLDYDFDKDISVSGSIFGELKIHPKTKIIDDLIINSDTIIVDSTLGFSSSGTLSIKGSSDYILVTYNGKTVNQFLNCSGIVENFTSGTEIYENVYAYGYSKINGIKQKIKFRINGVLSDIELPDNTFYYQKDDTGRIITLGYNENSFKDNNWIFNKTVRCNVKNFTPDGNFTYNIETYDDNGIYSGDSVEIEYLNQTNGSRETLISQALIPSGSIPRKTFKITTNGISISNIFSVKRLIRKYSNKYVTDVLNVYKNLNEDEIFITSSSLPSYLTPDTLKTFKYTLSGLFSGDTIDIQNHGFITGDEIEYKFENSNQSLGISSGVYYVKKINGSQSQLKLSRSKYDIESGKFVGIGETNLTTSSNNTISLLRLSKENDSIDSQKLVRVIKNPVNDEKTYKTPTGTTGILINGVEILNYKSNDFVHYGPIKSIEVLSPGNNYDVINPPTLEISSSIGSTAKGYCGVEGSLNKINIIDGGFDYIDTPLITISGGGGFGAKAFVKMVSYEHFIDFNSSSSNSNISLSNDVIGFSTSHKFRDGESVIYQTSNNQPIGGLTTDAKYFVKVIDDNRIKLHKSYNESIVGINTINITSFGVGNHRFNSTNKKKKIDSIVIESEGSNYKNKKISIPSSGINTTNNTINSEQIPYVDGDIIYYYGGTTNISGLSTGSYYITKVNETSFKLSQVGVGSTSRDFYYRTNQYVDLKSNGVGNHIFNYEPIEVKVTGKLGISTVSSIDLSAKVQPVFRGKITSAFSYEGGVGYGSSEIINFNKQPDYNLNMGSNAILTPIVSNGKIVSVVINNPGDDYNSPPDLVVRGFGIGSKLTAVIENGKIVDVKVISGGINYEKKNTSIDVLTSGEGCKLKFYPEVWNINNFSRIIDYKKSSIDDDGIVYEGNNSEYGNQYTHLYAPRSLRDRVYTEFISGGLVNYRSDAENDKDDNQVKYHSPLIGWAYDGNPIYGPYGYISPTNKKVKQLSSGYKSPIDNQQNRPNKNTFPAGFFVEDYIFTDSGDLDEHNGRFCVTPEYPNGTYAYFMTVDPIKTLGSVKEPTFPYIIGNTFKSKPIEFNLDVKSNQDLYDLNNPNYIRNTNPCNTLSENSAYDHILKLSQLSDQKIKIRSTKKGSIDSVKIVSGGNNYKIGDRLIFNNLNSRGNGVSAKVNYIKGKTISGISQTSRVTSDVEFYPLSSSNRLIGFSSNIHNFQDNDYIFINSLSDYDSSVQGGFNIGIRSESLILSVGVADTSVTGIVTYFYVSGILDFPSIRENDILRIDSEDIKVLNIDKDSSRIRVLRNQNLTVSSAHSAYSYLYERPRKFYINLNTDLKNKNYKLNTQLYFDPKESLGIGTIAGIGYTITISNPGVGQTSIIVPTKSIYLKDHKLETGDQLIYNTNSGIGITVTNGITNFTLSNNSIVYAAKLSNDLVGISTVKVGLGTTGEFVGISQTASTLFFTNIGTGNYHSFTTNYNNVSKGNIVKNTITVSTASTHKLSLNDSVVIEAFPGISTTIVVRYNDYHNRMIINPRSISSIDTVNNLIVVNGHNYTTGEKLIYTSSTPSIGLENQGIYYVIVYDENRIRLSNSYYNATRKDKLAISITSSSAGTLSQINPKIKIIKNQNVIFDLSDSSLSSPLIGSGNTSAFDFNLFSDKNFQTIFFPINSDGTSKINKTGNIGITSNANLKFKVDSEFPNFIYYNLIPKIIQNAETLHLESDEDSIESNKIVFINSNLNGSKIISGITSNSFSFQNNYLENINYSPLSGDFRYYTNSTSETGEIESVKITSEGTLYEKLPSISSISSIYGTGAILIPQSKSIGKINKCDINDIGYDYPIDKTLKPIVKFPSIVRVEPLSTIESIEVLFPGINYITKPNLIVIDGFTDNVVNDVYLDYDIINSKINIIKNTKGLYNVTPRVIPINNSNGLGISSISYNSSTKIVTAFFTKQFSDPGTFPFSVGENVFVEGVSVVNSSDKGFNSKNYNYEVFPIVGVNTNLGGSGSAITYSLENYIESTENTGIFDSQNSSGRIISENHFPKFKVNLSKNYFIYGEEVVGSDTKGKVLKWDSENEYLNVEVIKDFDINSLITGTTSKSQAFIRDIFKNESFCNIDSSSIVNGNWNKDTGFLNNNSQRIQDNDYYQNFSYSLKSEIPIQEWNDAVSNLNHTLGFKKFSDLIVESIPLVSGISTTQNEGLLSSISDLNSIVDIECINDYDLVSENYFYVQDTLTSDEIIFNSVILQDYFESIGNRVLTIDDISTDFNTSLSKTFVTSFYI